MTLLNAWSSSDVNFKVDSWQHEIELSIKALAIENKELKEEISALKTFTKLFYVYFSSEGEAALHQGGVLGQYEFNPEKGCYVQTSTERSEEKFKPIYLYQDGDEKWWVGKTPFEKWGYLYFSKASKTLPKTGWSYAKDGIFHEDSSLILTPGPLPPLPRQMTVTATGAAAEACPDCLGVFTKTKRWWWGRPIYVNKRGQLLHHGLNTKGVTDSWQIGEKLGTKALTGSRAHHSPVNEDRWRYYTGSEWKMASVTVTGSE